MDLNNSITSKYIINCANLNQIQIKTERIRRGQFKTTDVGILMAKRLLFKYFLMKLPIERKTAKLDNFFMKEIFMLNQLDHPGLIQM